VIYSCLTVVLQWSYSGLTVVLQWCYSGVKEVINKNEIARTWRDGH
jgi:hypothetical protein